MISKLAWGEVTPLEDDSKTWILAHDQLSTDKPDIPDLVNYYDFINTEHPLGDENE